MSVQNQKELIQKFYEFVPGSTTYKKPCSAGLKTGDSGKNKRRARLPEPQLFDDRVALPPPPATKVVQREENESSEDRNLPDESESNIDMLFNPDRKIDTDYQLVHRSDTKSCPKSVKRCQVCNRSFSEADIVIIKTQGVREYHCSKTGKEKRSQGNIYIHFLTKCLTTHDKNYKVENVRVPHCTSEKLASNVLQYYRKKGMKFM